MDLNVYAGTLTRYYMGKWHLPGSTEEMEAADMTEEEIQDAAEGWQEDIIRALVEDDNEVDLVWDEDTVSPYFAWGLGWQSFEALRLYGACRLYGEQIPESFLEGAALDDYPVFQKLRDDEDMNWSIYLGALLWLPLEDEFSFKAPLPTGQEGTISTAASLLCELDQINDLEWNAEEEEIIDWAHTEGAAIGTDNTVSLAKYAFSVLYRAALYALDHDVPALMNY